MAPPLMGLQYKPHLDVHTIITLDADSELSSANVEKLFRLLINNTPPDYLKSNEYLSDKLMQSLINDDPSSHDNNPTGILSIEIISFKLN